MYRLLYRTLCYDLQEVRKMGQLRQYAFELCRKKYGNTPPSILIERLEYELEDIEKKEHEQAYLFAAQTYQPLIKNHISFWISGPVGCSFVAYLMGLTAVNPLPPHYYCPQCRRVEMRLEKEDGFDLPACKCSTCGEFMIGDGHDLRFIWFSGEGESINPYFMEASTSPCGIRMLQEEPQNRSSHILALQSTQLAELEWLQRNAGIKCFAIPIRELTAYPEWGGLSFCELIKKTAISHLTVKEAALLTPTEEELFFDRDAVLDYLTHNGLSEKEGFYWVEMIRRGKISYKPETFRPFLERWGSHDFANAISKVSGKILYLPSRSYTIAYLISSLC